jgi:D-sedoheptulose 7-phosphate isomerase
MTSIAVTAEVAPDQIGTAAAYCAASNAAARQLFDERADAIALACHGMAERFLQGGRLFVAGDGAQRSDVAHVVVEFLHPVVVGKRALPAIGLPDVQGGAAGASLTTLARVGDLLMMLTANQPDHSARELLAQARKLGVRTILLAGAASAGDVYADHHFSVPSADPCIVQETHEFLYHVLWELVHVCFERRTDDS